MRKLMVWLAVVAAAGIVSYYTGRELERRSFEPAKQELEERRASEPLRRQGSIEYAGLSRAHESALLATGFLREETVGKEKLHTYDLRSFDHGKNWVAVQTNGAETRILGPADRIFPGLVRVLDEWDAVLKSLRLEVVKE